MKKLLFLFILLLFTITSCDKDKSSTSNNNNQVNAVVNIYIYKNTPEFFNLQVPGGWMYKQGGNCGVIIYRIDQNENNDDFVAYERNCPFEGIANLNAVVNVNTDNISAEDTICGSKFYLTNGGIINGPAANPLKQYNVTYDGNVLHIFN
jgi:nitrite reductase/ring-hydroxylating ferredoxin subunit